MVKSTRKAPFASFAVKLFGFPTAKKKDTASSVLRVVFFINSSYCFFFFFIVPSAAPAYPTALILPVF
jgi:hypothetical protein